MRVKKPRGTRDFSPKEMYARSFVRGRMESVFRSFNYDEILFPTIEHARLFEVKSGEEIGEHMYVFEDKGGRKICLRPEATASVCRMFVEGLRDMKKPLKLYYFGPMFRYERPQKGRYREFWQMGGELIGASDPVSDAEVIALAYKSLKTLELDFRLDVGHLGVLRGLMDELGVGEGTQDKIIFYLDKGDDVGLRSVVEDDVILDLVGVGGCGDALNRAEKLLRGYKEAFISLMELKEIVKWLDAWGIDYCVDLGIARGLSYYTGMVFEVRVEGLGAENQICGGGRYDKLIELFGGPPTPAVGFAFGFDRVLDALEAGGVRIPVRRVDVIVAPVNDEVRGRALEIASVLRERFVVDVDLLGRRLGRILDYGGEINARFAVIVGPDDLLRGEVTLRDMVDGEQVKVALGELAGEVGRRLG